MANFMDSILIRKPGWSKFPLTHEVKTSLEFGKITPFFIHETTPGEKLRLTSEVQLKFSPLISPVMHRINLFTNYFYIPYYTIWSAYEDFFGGGREGNVHCEPPYLTPLDIVNICWYVADRSYDTVEPPFKTDMEKAIYGYHNSWFDYIGIPLQLISAQFDKETGLLRELVDETSHLNMLPLMSCWKAYHDYFQDENLDDTFQDYEDLFNVRKDDWISSAYLSDYADYHLYILPSRAWEHDYFTSALPWAQRGEQVEVPLSGNAPVTIPDQEISLREVGITFRNPIVTYNGGALPSGATHWEIFPEGNNIKVLGGDSNSIEVLIQSFDDDQHRYGAPKWVNVQSIQDVDVASQITAGLNRALSGSADLSQASAVSINTFRWLERLQTFLEKNARAGYRYVEQLLAHWGVRGDDLRLMRAQYLSGSVQPVKIGEVLQTSETTDDSPQAQYAGYAAAYGNMNGFKRKFKYHGFVVGFMTVMPRTAYFQGIPRMFLRNSKYDYLFPEFAHLGEQPVYEGELYYNLDDDGEVNTKKTFGYMPRYSDYRTVPSQIHGDFQDTMKFWHLGREFSSVPQLNKRFIYSNPSKRIFAVESEEYAHIWCQVLNKCSAWLPLSKYGTPTL